MKTDNAALTQMIDRCFDLSMDGRLKPEQRKEFLALGKRLRGSLLNLLTAEFGDATQAVTDANNGIKELNSSLSTITQELASVSQVIAQVGQLVSLLDELLKVASKFA